MAHGSLDITAYTVIYRLHLQGVPQPDRSVQMWSVRTTVECRQNEQKWMSPCYSSLKLTPESDRGSLVNSRHFALVPQFDGASRAATISFKRRNALFASMRIGFPRIDEFIQGLLAALGHLSQHSCNHRHQASHPSPRPALGPRGPQVPARPVLSALRCS